MYRGLRMIAHEAAWWAGRLHAHIRACEVRDSEGLPGPQPEQENGSGRPVQRQVPEIVGPEQDGAVDAAATDVRNIHRCVEERVDQRPYTVNGHQVMSAGIQGTTENILFCVSCGAFSRKRVRQLKKE